MGGKTKQSQRTKNNARPSSSGRSALLLSNVKYDTGVVNVAGTELPALFPTLVAPSIDPLVSPELQLCIKKLNKKDPITKTKALQELSELVSNSKVDDVVAALPSWAHFYRLLTADPDRKVREATQSCHGTIVSVCGRRLAPRLKQLMPAWLQAQYDEHAPAQTYAQNSLAKTFPDSKLPEVISFCKSEVMSHLIDNLIGTGESAFIRKCDTEEERSEQAARLATGSLRGLQYVTEHLPPQHGDWLWGHLGRLLRPAHFWGRAAHADCRVRAAWYGLVGRMVARYGPQFAADAGHQTLRVLVGRREDSPLAAAQLWDCLLLFMYNVQDWPKYLDKEDLLKKRILDLLESGGWGDARRLLNMLLPLLAHLPPTMLTKEFYIIFFEAIFNGLDKKTVLSSKSERQSWITSLDECLRYLSIQQQDYVLEVVTTVHRTWLQRILSDTHDGLTRTNLIKYSAGSMAALVKYWLRQAKEAHSEKYDQLIRNFWQNVGATIVAQIDKLSVNPADINKSMEAHMLLLQTLKTSFIQEAKKHQSIKFDGDSPTVAEKPKETVQCDPSIIERYNHNLNESVEKICGHYLEFASKKQISDPVLTPLITLLIDFDSKSLFVAIARQFDCDSTYKFYEKVLRTWLTGDTMRCKALVDIIFLFIKHLSESEQDALFDSFKQFPPSVVEWCIRLSLSHPHNVSPPVRRWLRGPAVEASVISVCRRLIEQGDSKAKDLLLLCLNNDANGETIISSSAVSKALDQLSAALSAADCQRLDAVSGVAECQWLDAVSGVAECQWLDAVSGAAECQWLDAVSGAAARAVTVVTAPAATRLALELFALTARMPVSGGAVTDNTRRDVCAAWRGAGPRGELLRGGAASAAQHLPRRPKTLDIKRIEHVVSLCPLLLCNGNEVLDFTKRILDRDPPDPLLVEMFILRHSIIAGDINCPFEDGDITEHIIDDCARETIEEVTEENLVIYLNDCLVRGVYLKTIFLYKVDEDLEETWCNVLLSDGYFVEETCKVMHDYIVVSTMYEAYAFSPHYKLIEVAKLKLDTLLEAVIAECAEDTKTRILDALTEAAAVKGYYWAFTRRWFELNATSKQKENRQILETVDSNQEKVDSGQENTDSGQEKVESDHVNIDSSQEKVESDHENIDNSQEKVESDQEKFDTDQEKTEIGHSKKDSCIEAEQRTKGDDNVEGLDFQNLKEIVTGSGFFHTLQANVLRGGTEADVLRGRYVLMLRTYYVAYGADVALAGEDFLRDVRHTRRDCGADVIVNAYYRHQRVMLYETDVSQCSWSQLSCTAAVCDYLSQLVSARGWDLAAHHWDFITITLCNLLASLNKAKGKWDRAKVALLARSVLHLYVAVERFVRSVSGESTRRRPSEHVAHLPREWEDIFTPDLHSNLRDIIVAVLESGSRSVTGTQAAVVAALVGAARGWGGAGAGVRAALGALARPAHYCYKYLAYAVLQAAVKSLVLQDAALLAASGGGAAEEGGEGVSEGGEGSSEGGEGVSEGGERAPLAFSLLLYHDTWRHLADLVTTATAHVRLCEDTCSLVEFTDAHGLALSWLMLADVAAAHCRLARGDLRHHYIELGRERKYWTPLLTTALRLLPAEVVARAQAPPAAATAAPTAARVDMFHAMPPLGVYRYCGAEAVSAAACRGVALCVRGAGAGEGRGWRGAAPHRHAALLDAIVTEYISPTAVKEEFTLVQQRASELEDTEITVHWSSYELSCVLRVEERPLELRVTLSRSHPLGLPRLVAPEHAPAGNTQWLVMYMGYQDGSLLNALKMWISAVTSKVERSPQCYICYCRLHYSTSRLPAIYCYQCRNKFHTACLRKWFRTSNKSNCPLCRASF